MQVQRRRISELRSHPRQQSTYGDLSDREFLTLKEDISRRGVRQPIVVTHDGTIVDGHQRVRACEELGIEEIDAVISQDTEQADIDEGFVLSNLNRRQLDPLSKARALQSLMEIEYQRKGKELNTQHDGDFRDRLAELLGGNISGRTIDRYLQLLRLPQAIQDAVSSGDLPMTKALKVESLDEDSQEEIVRRIAKGKRARDVVAEYVVPKKDVDTPEDLYYVFIDFLKDNVNALEAAAKSLPGSAGSCETTVAVLEHTARFCETMRRLELEAGDEAEQSTLALLDGLGCSWPDTVSGHESHR